MESQQAVGDFNNNNNNNKVDKNTQKTNTNEKNILIDTLRMKQLKKGNIVVI